MKKIVFTLLMAFIISCEENKINLSKIEFDKDHIVLGDIAIDQSLEFYIIINNTSDSSILKILGVESSCDCTLLSKSDFVINPKTSDSIKIKFTPKKIGHQEQSVVIKSNTKPPFNNIKISANVR